MVEHIVAKSTVNKESFASKIKWYVGDIYHLLVPQKHIPVSVVREYRIDEHMIHPEKILNGRKEKEIVLDLDHTNHRLLVVLQKDISTSKGTGRVIDYVLDGTNFQLYDRGAIEALWLLDDLPTKDDIDMMVSLAGSPQDFLQNNFEQHGTKSMLPGYCDHTEHLQNFRRSASCWVWLPLGNSGIVKDAGGMTIAPTYVTYQQTHPRDFLSLLVRKK